MEKKLIYIIDDEENLTRLVSHWIQEKWGYQLKIFKDGEEYFSYEAEQEPDCIILDIMLPKISGVEILKRIKAENEELPVIMLSAQGNIETAIETLRLGAFDYLSKPIDLQKLQVTIKNAIQTYELSKEVKQLREETKKQYTFDNIIAIDSKMEEVFKLMQKVLNTPINVLIYGESGTGKELIARAIHYNSDRKDKPFIVVNCASIPRELLESELFGHEKGAFTGAYYRKIGKFEAANSGTIFLDEIGELELSLQAKLLRVIQEKSFERVGSNIPITTDARIISATNKNLKEAVDQKLFREDLYYRLSSFPITIPPLRTRKSDILILAEHFVKIYAKEAKKAVPTLSRRVMQILLEYPWPGNVRELENAMQRAVILADEDQIQVKDLPLSLQSFDVGETTFEVPTKILQDENVIIPFEKLKEEAIRNALKICNGQIVEAARRLKIGRATIYRLIEKYKIDINSLR
ncbi:MAG: sigma-54 dependent transcriptional regulator [Ignavibacteria bacterium]|nr:sigma-54 dependent transcriptional regulator [Ignavibacteria bacterium]